MKISWIVLGICFFAINASADFSGDWSGSGKAFGNLTVPCAETLSFKQSATTFSNDTFYFSCGDWTLIGGPLSFQIQNKTDLIYQGRKVGTISDQAVHFTLPDSDGQYSWNLTQSGDTLTFSETDLDRNGIVVQMYVGTLKRK